MRKIFKKMYTKKERVYCLGIKNKKAPFEAHLKMLEFHAVPGDSPLYAEQSVYRVSHIVNSRFAMRSVVFATYTRPYTSIQI